MVNRIIVILFFAISYTTNAQNETANWFFGEQAGLNFNSGFPSTNLDGLISTTEGCSTISNSVGELIFYTDGITVWNRNHEIMQNGDGLTGDDSSTQSAIIIPKPNSDSIYYIFTVDARGGEFGLRYSEVNTSLDNGLGSITNNKNILLETPTTEKITAVESSDGESIWVISHKWDSNEFIAYLVSDTGINTIPVISAVGSIYTNDINNTIGYLKASPNREKIACVKSYTNNEVQVFDFNATTGLLSNPITINNFSTENLGPYGCEFSPDSRLLYVSEIIINNDNQNTSKIHQYDLTQSTQQNILQSDTIITEENGVLGALQQALDGRIYIAKLNTISLSVINKPNTIGINCLYESESIQLGNRICRLGLPPFFQSYFFARSVFQNTCFGDTTIFSIDTATEIDSINWNFGDPNSGANNNSSNANATHIYSAPGTYTITITIETEGEIQIVYRTLNISNNTPPILNLDNLTACQTSDIESPFDLTTNIPQEIINNDNYTLSFYQSYNDADNKSNSILLPNNYSITNNNEIIYLRIDVENGNCYSISEFELSFFTSPDIEILEEVNLCNTNNSEITINAGNLILPESDYSFFWLNSNENTYEIQINESGTYTVRIAETASISLENPNGCFSERTVIVNSSNSAIIESILTSSSNVTVIVSGLGDYEYSIDNIDGPYQNENIFFNISSGIHTIYVKDKNTCSIIMKQFLTIDFPKYFTPNGDSISDFWQISKPQKNMKDKIVINIFDRFGKLLSTFNSSNRGWDGTFNGEPMPTSDYWFSVTLEDGRVYKNHFTLKR